MKKILSLLFLIISVQCTTKPPLKRDVTDTGVWQGKLQLINEQTKDKKWANVTWASDSENDRMRIDIAAIMDIPLGTFIRDQQGSHLWMFTENKYFTSENGERLIQHLTQLSFDPENFFKLLGNLDPLEGNWKCSSNEERYRCASKANGTTITVESDASDERIITIKKDLKALRLRLNKAKGEVQESHFKLLPTSQFKTIRI